MKRLKKVVSLITLLVLVGTDFLNPISYALGQQEENFEVVKNNSLEEISGEEESVNEVNDEVENIGDDDISGESDEDEEYKGVEVNDNEESVENEYTDETDDEIDNDFGCEVEKNEEDEDKEGEDDGEIGDLFDLAEKVDGDGEGEITGGIVNDVDEKLEGGYNNVGDKEKFGELKSFEEDLGNSGKDKLNLQQAENLTKGSSGSAEKDGIVTYTVTFDANRGTFNDGIVPNIPTPKTQNISGGNLITQAPNVIFPGYDFAGWYTQSVGGTEWDLDNDVVVDDITLYAHWDYGLIYGNLDVYMIDSDGHLVKYVMMDRNLGATAIYDKNFANPNFNSFGYAYQWGNNYGFPRIQGNNNTYSWADNRNSVVPYSDRQNRLPSKYASSTWVTNNNPWHEDRSESNNLRGGVSGTDEATQGPCPDGYHLMKESEIGVSNSSNGLLRVWARIYNETPEGSPIAFSFPTTYQKIFTEQFLWPMAGAHKKGNFKEQEQGLCADYWCAKGVAKDTGRNIWFCKDDSGNTSRTNGGKKIKIGNAGNRNTGSPVRCFKNSTDSANLTIEPNGGTKGLISIDKLNGVNTINAIKEPEKTQGSINLIFSGWYTSPDFEGETYKTGGDTLSDAETALYAKWDCPEGLVYNSNNQCASGVLVRFMNGENVYTGSTVLSGEEVSAPAVNPEKMCYIFTGWFETGAQSPFVFTGTPITGDLYLYAHWDTGYCEVITGVVGNGSIIDDSNGDYIYGKRIKFTASPIDGYIFEKWVKNGEEILSGGSLELDVVLTGDLELTGYFVEAEVLASCDLTNYGGGTLLHGNSMTVYSTAGGECPTMCTMGTITCNNGTLEGDIAYMNTSCIVTEKTCSLVNYPLSSCPAHGICNTQCVSYTVSENACVAGSTRYKLDGCDDGYTQEGNECKANCTFNGQPVVHGASVTGYDVSSATCPDECKSEIRTCNNGTLSGTYTNASCTTQPVEVDEEEYPLTSCPANGSCVAKTGYTVSENACVAGSTRYKLDGCDNGYHKVYNECISNTQTVNCSTFSILNATPIVSTFIQTWDGEGWTPETKEWTEGGSECGFTCNTNYHYSGSVCVSDVYTITWLNEDGTLIDTTTVSYGTIPTHADASQDSDDQYDYTFKAWDPTPVAVTGNATYRATYNYNIRSYDISILPNDTNYGTVDNVLIMANYGTLISVNANVLTIGEETVTAIPAESGAQYSYGFSGWILNNCETGGAYKVLPNCTITAEFTQTLRQYTVTFVDESGATLKEPTVYDYGTLVENIIKPVDPEKAATAQYTYTFVGWDPTLADVTEDVTYTATYSGTLREYEITWLNEDGSSIDTTMVAYGTVPSHADASQPADAQYTYEFAGWDPTPVAVTGDATYRATYNYIKNTYTITWLNDDGSLIGTTTLEYGEMPFHVAPLKPADDEFTYYFSGWDPAIVTVVGNAEYKATYTAEKKGQNNGQNNGHNMSGGGRIGNDDSDNQHGSAEEIQDGSEFTGDIESMLDDPNEALSLYEWARENDVTTMDTLEDANPDGLVTRGHLAKMVVNYMVNVLGREMPYDVTYNCVYWGDDESVWESNEIRDYATKACAFGVMGINMENNEFLPNNIVTRAEFGTVMSRVLWGDRYNIIDTDNRSYYEDHLRALKKNGILKQINDPEDRWEIRKWVWLVFRRVKEKKK